MTTRPIAVVLMAFQPGVTRDDALDYLRKLEKVAVQNGLGDRFPHCMESRTIDFDTGKPTIRYKEPWGL